MILRALNEKDVATGMQVGSVPGIPGVHSQGHSVEEVRKSLAEVLDLLRAQGVQHRHQDGAFG
jgi:predicted RNase H-like HicB family nuclease